MAVQTAATAGEGRWRRLHRVRHGSGPVRMRDFIRYSLYTMGVFQVVAQGGWLLQHHGSLDGRVVGLLAFLTAVPPVLGALVTRAAIPHYLGRAPRPTALTAAHAAVVGAGLSLVLVLMGTGALPLDATLFAAWLFMHAVGPLLLALPLRGGVAVAAGGVVAATLGAGAAGLPGDHRAAFTLGVAMGAALFGVAYRWSGWMLRVVDELDAAREAQARLAVAEERLRFGRDLHDVMGRNLAVIALKSELAAELARRGSPAAVEQMVEVQRIAHESQREVREVVRGYREADLDTELAGAAGILRAAGIACAIEDGGAHRLPPAVQSALGWVVREGTTNVLRHSDARRCAVRLRVAGGRVVLTMDNDGVPQGSPDGTADAEPAAHGRAAGTADATRDPSTDPGPDPGAAGGAGAAPARGGPATATAPAIGRPPGHGLTGLRERLAPLGGTLTAGPLPGGYLMTVELPLEASA